MPNGGQADVTMLGVSAEGAGLTKENFNSPAPFLLLEGF
jgi:hypothetical protein